MNNKKPANYRTGGLVMLPFVSLGLVAALVLQAPLAALWAIIVCGYGAAFTMIAFGKAEN